nr:MAG TPA: hypothetical protein [Caudoviricetes sp.]
MPLKSISAPQYLHLFFPLDILIFFPQEGQV